MTIGPIDIPSNYSLDDFLAGIGGDCGDVVIDDGFAKPLSTIVADAARFEAFRLNVVDEAVVTPSIVDPNLVFLETEGGLLLTTVDGEIVGAYLGPDVAVRPDYQRRGLGAELILEYFMRNGNIPNWESEKAAYSHGGYAAHTSAWNLSQDSTVMVAKMEALEFPQSLEKPRNVDISWVDRPMRQKKSMVLSL